MAAVLSSDMDNTDKVVVLIEECRQMKLVICPPDINVSNYRFTVDAQGHIVYGLGAVKGVGQAAIEDMLENRAAHADFTGLYDLCQRVDLRKFNRRVLEALIRAGAFDVFDDNRAAHLAELPMALKVAEQHGKMAQTGQDDLFGLMSESANESENAAYASTVEPWTENERLAAEKLTLGLFLTGHPIEQYLPELQQFTQSSIAALLEKMERSKGKMNVRVAGLVVEVRTRQTKNGKTMGFATLDDKTGRLEVAAFGPVYDSYRDIFVRDSLLVAEGELGVDDYLGTLRLNADKLYNIDQARVVFARHIQLSWDAAENTLAPEVFMAKLKAVLQPFSGGTCPIILTYSTATEQANVQFGDQWRINPTDVLLGQLKVLLGANAVLVKYR